MLPGFADLVVIGAIAATGFAAHLVLLRRL